MLFSATQGYLNLSVLSDFRPSVLPVCEVMSTMVITDLYILTLCHSNFFFAFSVNRIKIPLFYEERKGYRNLSSAILLASLYNGSDSQGPLHLPPTSCHGSLYGGQFIIHTQMIAFSLIHYQIVFFQFHGIYSHFSVSDSTCLIYILLTILCALIYIYFALSAVLYAPQIVPLF